ncbi:MAG TPA: TULIP family P47-like protein [Longimicrobium sp.]|nr:TULIP family P47-like protein [Longimicrobium sp.]
MTTTLLPTIPQGKVMRVQLHDAALFPRPAADVAGTAQPGTTEPFDTNGWDTVYAIRLPDVNAAIAAQGTSPTAWQASLAGSMFSAAVDAQGTFGPWRLVNGAGSGTTLRMEIPFPSATLTVNGAATQVTGGLAHVEVKLQYLPRGSAGGTPNALLLRTTSADPVNDPVVSVSGVSYDSPAHDEGLDAVLERCLDQWFNQHLAEFTHVFATVNLGATAASEGFQWLQPTSTSYAYVDDADDINNALLGVLCMVLCHSPDQAIEELAGGAIPDQEVPARSAFSISRPLFLSQMVLPMLPQQFTRTDASYFAITHNNTEIDNTQTIPMDPVEHAGISYDPEITTFRITINADVMETYAHIHIPISPGIDAYSEVTYYSTLTMGTRADGTPGLTWKQAQPTDQNSWYTVATWVTVTEIVADLVLAVAAAVAGAVTVAVERVVVRVIIGLLIGGVAGAIAKVMEKIPEWIAGDVPNDLPSLDPFIASATSATQWAGGGEFTLTGVSLNGALQLGGNPGFAHPAAG